ncbi:hypothetical protein V5O48_012801 [Marasmius crinis-equi]|uniref:Uncharacterized protein n=1 Tax=Marasmius crinis-equi TaxID=585013 RepID=A0ABR3F1U4_9AGAR
MAGIHWLHGRTRYHRERLDVYIEQTEQAVEELESTLCAVVGYFDLTNGREEGTHNSESHPVLPVRVDAPDETPPVRVDTPEDFYMDKEFDELARSVMLTPDGGHVLLPEADSQDEGSNTSNILGQLLGGEGTVGEEDTVIETSFEQ